MIKGIHFHITILAALALVLLPQYAFAQDEAGDTKETHVYAVRDGQELRLDVHRPQEPRADHAAVISLFGGGFFGGARDNDNQLRTAAELTRLGYTVINMEYRLGLRDSAKVAQNKSLFKLTGLFKYCIDIATEDCAAAVAWVCQNAEMLGIDKGRIVLVGSSAGAITVLQLDYSRCNGLPQAQELPAGWKPAAVVSYSGGVMCRKSKLKYPTPPAPTLLFHGDKDKIVNYKSFGMPLSSKLFGSSKIDHRMDRQDIPHWFISYDGLGHEVSAWQPGSADIMNLFVDKVLAGQTSDLEATMSDSGLTPTRWSQMNMFDLYRRK